MDKKSFYVLCDILTNLTGIEDIGYHRIFLDRLQPVIKSHDGKITQDEWIKKHTDNPVLVANNPMLVELLCSKKKVYIKDASLSSTNDMDFFEVHSVYMFPIVIANEVVGVIPLVSIGTVNSLKDELILECELAIKKFTYIFE
ncbi:hypothetical protein LGK97_07900 [Clostridium sp. CS001]|uniref:hypothetical protein n=1 Tax=Clostridium sp. CS001 TaxID=2880648 RepID=UPI001CF4B870|nr:hypothetical protein [Clostridium sp. CS001]MCB2289685.1 hypothetical protein [Clostridium sp. CS001]